MMQLDSLVLYNKAGDQRRISFLPGRLNVITGESGTGKTSLIGIIRFLLGGDQPHVPVGPIQETVAWYGLLAHVGDTPFFIGRPAPRQGETTALAMLSIGQTQPIPFAHLESDTNKDDLVAYLGGLLGIGDNEHVPPAGQTRRPLIANLRHSLYYCFQGQGEIANPNTLFHHQDRKFQDQAIKDTLPYFLGAQGLDALKKREMLAQLRREIRKKVSELRLAEEAGEAGVERAMALISQARSVGLSERVNAPTNLREALDVLTDVLNGLTATIPLDDPDVTPEPAQLVGRRQALRDQLRELNDSLRKLEDFARVDSEYENELNEHRARLASIGLVPTTGGTDATPVICPICSKPIDPDEALDEVRGALEVTATRLSLAHRDRPKTDSARRQLQEQRDKVKGELSNVTKALDELANADDARRRATTTWEQQSFVRGRIAQYLETLSQSIGDNAEQLRRELESLESNADQLDQELDSETLRASVASLLSIVGRRMTELAQEVPLEHSERGVRIDPNQLTVVADTLNGPAYMNLGAIGSGMSWVGYHLTVYLALQEFFIEANRPVPRFVVLDQLSQAFFPRDQENGGELSELSDTDRENTRKLYQMIAEVVDKQAGQLQIIALDHADFQEPWFQDSVIETWRGGRALIPPEWLGDAE